MRYIYFCHCLSLVTRLLLYSGNIDQCLGVAFFTSLLLDFERLLVFSLYENKDDQHILCFLYEHNSRMSTLLTMMHINHSDVIC